MIDPATIMDAMNALKAQRDVVGQRVSKYTDDLVNISHKRQSAHSPRAFAAEAQAIVKHLVDARVEFNELSKIIAEFNGGVSA